MNAGKVIPVLIETGWCIAMIDSNTNEPVVFWDKVRENFNGLLTMSSLFKEEQAVLEQFKVLTNIPDVSLEIIPVVHRDINGHITIKLKR